MFINTRKKVNKDEKRFQIFDVICPFARYCCLRKNV